MPFTVNEIVTIATQMEYHQRMQIIEQLQKSIEQKPLNDLSKFQPRNDLVIGNSDDFIHMNWERELNLDFPN